ncbi:hypothetical protein MS_027 [Vibrio phage VPMS1]|uniref:hypothetical protein n=1 Tax=Vibrio phage VPMS1 TaxID=1233488 RepID=UPI0003584B59|nr:hypothetical protein MS_027 [Vibrio phage VPMS1]AFV51106.1 hypothetical protein MS_027 [Vibrio phage VPMS1]
MKASELQPWPENMQPHEWPKGTLDCMNAALFTRIVFPTRKAAGVAMWPSSLYGAHVRPDGNSRHSTKGGTRLSDATDMHVKSHRDMILVFNALQANKEVGGIGLYFDTNTPMIHMDNRSQRIMWLRVEGEYIYAHKDQVRFYKELGKVLEG